MANGIHEGEARTGADVDSSSGDANDNLADDAAVPLGLVGLLGVLERVRLRDKRTELGLSKGIAHVLKLPAAANEDTLQASRLVERLGTNVGVLLVLAI
jgi:hypothetical protein